MRDVSLLGRQPQHAQHSNAYCDLQPRPSASRGFAHAVLTSQCSQALDVTVLASTQRRRAEIIRQSVELIVHPIQYCSVTAETNISQPAFEQHDPSRKTVLGDTQISEFSGPHVSDMAVKRCYSSFRHHVTRALSSVDQPCKF